MATSDTMDTSVPAANTQAASSLKRVDVDLLRPGMYVHRIEGKWLSHGFWRQAFRITAEGREQRRLLDSGIQHVWIDTSKGADVLVTVAGDEPAQATSCASPSDGSTPPKAAGHHRSRPGEEWARAPDILRNAKQVVGEVYQQVRLGQAVDEVACRSLVDEVVASVSHHPTALLSMARLKSVDSYTHLHSVAVCTLMVSLARTVGLNEAQQQQAGFAGLLHDVGKALIPLEILNKPGPLTEAEMNLIKRHPELGHEMLGDAGEAVSSVCLQHHERLDGLGYPRGLKGTQISHWARLSSICDVYDALTSDRPYKTAWDPAMALSKMATWKGQFDHETFLALVTTLGIFPVGSLVRLSSQKLAVVIEHKPAQPRTPLVKVFYSLKSQHGLTPYVVDLSRSRDQIVERMDSSAWRDWKLDEHWLLHAASGEAA